MASRFSPGQKIDFRFKTKLSPNKWCMSTVLKSDDGFIRIANDERDEIVEIEIDTDAAHNNINIAPFRSRSRHLSNVQCDTIIGQNVFVRPAISESTQKRIAATVIAMHRKSDQLLVSTENMQFWITPNEIKTTQEMKERRKRIETIKVIIKRIGINMFLDALDTKYCDEVIDLVHSLKNINQAHVTQTSSVSEPHILQTTRVHSEDLQADHDSVDVIMNNTANDNKPIPLFVFNEEFDDSEESDNNMISNPHFIAHDIAQEFDQLKQQISSDLTRVEDEQQSSPYYNNTTTFSGDIQTSDAEEYVPRNKSKSTDLFGRAAAKYNNNNNNATEPRAKEALKSCYNNYVIPNEQTTDASISEYDPAEDEYKCRAKRKRKRKRKRKANPQNENVQYVKCPICKNRFKRQQYLNIHMTKHTGEKKYQCRWCGKQFRLWGSCNRHTCKVHGYNKKHYDAKPMRA